MTDRMALQRDYIMMKRVAQLRVAMEGSARHGLYLLQMEERSALAVARLAVSTWEETMADWEDRLTNGRIDPLNVRALSVAVVLRDGERAAAVSQAHDATKQRVTAERSWMESSVKAQNATDAAVRKRRAIIRNDDRRQEQVGEEQSLQRWWASA